MNDTFPIVGPGTYITRGGPEVVVEARVVMADSPYCWQGEVHGRVESWTSAGQFSRIDHNHRLDIVGKVAEPEERMTAREVMERWQSFAQPIDLTPPEKPMTKPFDPSKPVQTRDGRKARIIATDRADKSYPIVALIGDDDDISTFTAAGYYYTEGCGSNRSDLVNIVQKFTKWMNVYGDSNEGGRLWDRRDQADGGQQPRRTACIQVNWEEGEGL